jgi:putative transposase
MANTFTQIYIHLIFAVKHRMNSIKNENRIELYKYITGIIKKKNQKLLSVNGTNNHIHILIGMKPDTKLSDLVRDIKSNSCKFINEKKWTLGRFEWQEGFGAFSYSQSQIPVIAKYIENQEHHHKKKSFKEEYLEMLAKYNVVYDEKYLFDWI